MSDPETQAPDAQSAPPVTPQAEEPKVHPAYEKLLSELPEAWHSKVTPHLQEQDRYFQQQIEKYTPFKEYVEQGITPDLLSGGLNLARAIEDNPVEVFNSLKAYLVENGMLEKEAEKQAAEIISDEADEPQSEIERKLAELEKFKEEQLSRAQQAELDKATKEATAELDREMSALKSQYALTEQHEIAIYNLMNAALGAGKEMSLSDAAKQLQAMIGNFPAVGATQAPPTIIGGSGGAGVPAPDLSIPKSDAGKREMLAKMFQEYTGRQ